MALDPGLIVGSLVAEQVAAFVQIPARAVAGLHQDGLVVVADLMTKMTQHGAVRLAEVHPQPLPVSVQRFDQVDRDHSSGMPDGHALAGAVAGQQIEGHPTIATPERIDGQTQLGQLKHQAPQRLCG